jgi:hypothetical protein
MAETTQDVTLREGKYVFQLTQKITPRIQGEPPYPRKSDLRDRSLVKDPVTGKNRFLRYIPGASSMWLDEQDKLDATYAAMNAWKPVFEQGTLILSSPEDDEKIKVLMMRDEYDGKEGRISKEPPVYTLVNKEQEYTNEVDFMQQRHKAEGIALTAVWPDFTNHAVYLGISLTDGKRKREEIEVRGDYIKKATENPAVFLKSNGSPVANISAQVKLAISSGVIDMGHVKNQAHWADTKKLIAILDPKKDPTESLIAFALGDKGAELRERLSASKKKA